MVSGAAQDYYPDCPEPMLVSLASAGDRSAFAEIVRRRQSGLRNLMRRFCNDRTLADDLTQQVFLKVWTSLRHLRKPSAFGGWLKRVAVNVWLHHLRRADALRGAGQLSGTERSRRIATSIALDLDRALAQLAPPVRLCVVLSYHEGMSHREIVQSTGLPLGTVKTHIRTGAQQLQALLASYDEGPGMEGAG